MVARYAVKLVDMGTGERMPLLLDTTTGIGVFEPTAFSLAMRSKGRQVNTLMQALRATQFLYETLGEAGVDLMERAKGNDLLTLGEVEALVARCKFDRSELRNADEAARAPNIAPLRKALTKGRTAHYGVASVKGGTAAIRLHYIAAYLDWFADYVYLLKIPKNRREFRGVATLVVRAIKGRTPKSSSSKKRRKGITKEQERRLLDVVAPTSPENPWQGTFLRNRNYLIVRLLLDLGIRKGELLGLKIEDIDFGDNTVFVARRPDDPEDKRSRQPETKTEERTLAMAEGLATFLDSHLTDDRYGLGDARKHPFVIVSEHGDPLALNSVDYLFSTLRAAFPELAPVAAHLLRHTWNDRFSELAEGAMSQAEEKQLRNYMMGWADESKMAANYTARYVEQRGREMSLKMQNATYRESK